MYLHHVIHSYTFTALGNGGQHVLGFDMVDMLRPADPTPIRYYITNDKYSI